MDERRTQRLKQGYRIFSDTEQQVMPIIGKCLEGMKAAADSVDEKNVGVCWMFAWGLMGYLLGLNWIVSHHTPVRPLKAPL